MKTRALKALRRDKYLLLLSVPAIVYYAVFHYGPMYGLVMAFQDFSIRKGILGSEWVGLLWFRQLFSSPLFPMLLKNTLAISIYSLLWGFPIPIVFALLLNEVKTVRFKRVIQSISYFPYFVSVVVVVGMMSTMFATTSGVINRLSVSLGGQQQMFLSDPAWFRTMYVGSNVWQNFGFTAIIYLSAITAIDPQLYESSKIDGATRWQNVWHITLPCLLPTIIMMLILRMGGIMTVGFEKAYLMYKPANASVSDIISLYVYRMGIKNMEFGFATAVGLFNSVVNCALLLVTNQISKAAGGNGLW